MTTVTDKNSNDETWAALDDRGFSDRPRPRAGVGEEELRFIRNFHDVFLSIGLTIFILGITFVSVLVLGEVLNIADISNPKSSGWIVVVVMAIDAVLMWFLAESFARRRRLFLPAIVILLGFSGFVFWGLLAGYLTLFAGQDFSFENLETTFIQLRWLPAILFGGTGAAIFAFYARMKLPFAMGLGCLTLVTGVVYTYLTFTTDPSVVDGPPMQFLTKLSWLQLISGIFLFVLGLVFDARDPMRRTRFSDNAFWLHFFAAPAILGATLSLVSGISSNPLSSSVFSLNAASAAVTLLVVMLFALVSLLINRRALLVSGLLSAAIAIGVLVNETGLSGGWTAAVTLLLLGGAMVLLGGGWHTVRRFLVGGLPKDGPIARIIPPEPEPGEDDDQAARQGDE